MEKEFIPYSEALALKELGFDEPCLNFYFRGEALIEMKATHTFKEDSECVKAPLYQQAFRWFREKYNLHHSISILQRSCRYHFKIRTIECESDLKPFGDNKIIFEDGPRKKYEDIELDCLKKLIEIVKDGKK